MTLPAPWRRIGLTAALLLSAACDNAPDETAAAPGLSPDHPSPHLNLAQANAERSSADWASWQQQVPGIARVEIPSSLDDTTQTALFHAPDAAEDRPLLIVLHSWAADYRERLGIPLAQFAMANGWAYLQPNFRGPNDGRAESTASEEVLADLDDALAFAQEHARVDASRVYLLGYSGGGMNALHFAARHPERFAGVTAWVPVYDLVSWYQWNRDRQRRFATDIERVCGGPPVERGRAYTECVKRSPRAYVPKAAGEMRVLIAHGIDDDTVPPDQGLLAFNDLAQEEDRVSEAQVAELMRTRQVPATLAARDGQGPAERARFAEAGGEVLLQLRSGPAELVLFRGGHELFFRPALDWLARQQR